MKKKISFKKIADDFIKTLDKKDREIIILRFGLQGKKIHTLQAIANKYNLTRERIRQIENEILEFFHWKTKMNDVGLAVEHLEDSLKSLGNVAHKDDICELCGLMNEDESNYIRLFLQIGRNFYYTNQDQDHLPFYHLNKDEKDLVKKIIRKVHSFLLKQKKELFSREELLDIIKDIMKKESFKTKTKPETILRLSKSVIKNKLGAYGHKRKGVVSLNRSRDCAKLILSKTQKPMHYRDLYDEAIKISNKKINLSTFHNELVKNKDFVLVGRGIYVLENLGFKKGTVRELIVDILKKNKKGLKKGDIFNYMKKQRIIKPQTVLQALSDRSFFSYNKKTETYKLIG